MTGRKKLFVLLFILLCAANLFAQTTAVISGKVTDEKSNALKAVTVHLLNTNISVLTDENGNYNINNIRTGKYNISFSSVGYASQNKEVEITSTINNID